MSDRRTSALQHIREIGSPAELLAAAASNAAPAKVVANSHIHLPPNFSAFRDARHAVELAVAEGVNCLGTSNYYDFAVYADFAQAAREKNIFPLFGVEIIAFLDDLARKGVKINDPGNPGKMYLCGKGISRFDELSPATARMLRVIRKRDAARMSRMIALLGEAFRRSGVGVGLDERAVISAVAKRYGVAPEAVTLQERHLALVFQEALWQRVGASMRDRALASIFRTRSKADGDPARTQNEIRSHLMKAGKPAYVEEEFVTFDEAYSLVLSLDGVPCYPTLADGASPICAFEESVESLIAELDKRNIHCAEFIPNRNDPAVLRKYVPAMRAAGLVVTAGTEHNTLDLVPMKPRTASGEVPEDIATIFAQGACVIAAHQFLKAHGEDGFVLADGSLNKKFGNREELIRAMSSLGNAVIKRYLERREK